MKTISPELQALFAGKNFLMADLYKLTLLSATVYRYTSFDIDIYWDSCNYAHNALLFQRTKCSWKNDLSTDSLELEITPAEGGIIEGVPFLLALKNGVLDGAMWEISKAFLDPSTVAIVGVVPYFSGRTGEVLEASRFSCRLAVNSLTEILDADCPRNVYKPSCLRTLYAAGCEVNIATYTATGTVTGTPTVSSIPVSVSAASGYYANGIIKITSGPNDGIQRTVKDYDGTNITLFEPLPFAPAAGDGVTLIAGCDKTMATCENKFNNLPKFRGFPFIPVVEMAI